MNRIEHLLTVFGEECNEVAQRVSKALRFGLGEIEPEQSWTNAQRIYLEYGELLALFDMLVDEGAFEGCPVQDQGALARAKEMKRSRVQDFRISVIS